jgi:WD40 repeat protein
MDRSSVTPIPRPDDSPPRRPKKPERLFYKEKMVLRGHKRGVAAVKFSPDRKWIASCSADATIRIWETATGKHVRTLEGHLAGISTIAWSPDSKTLASGSDDKSIRLWDVATVRSLPTLLSTHLLTTSPKCRESHTPAPSWATTTTSTPSPSPQKATCSYPALTTRPCCSGMSAPAASCAHYPLTPIQLAEWTLCAMGH